MTEHRNATLEAAIAASPRDPQPYIAYSSWLTENGDPVGELLELERKLAPRVRDDSPFEDKKREKQLLRALDVRLNDPRLRSLVRDARSAFSRCEGTRYQLLLDVSGRYDLEREVVEEQLRAAFPDLLLPFGVFTGYYYERENARAFGKPTKLPDVSFHGGTFELVDVRPDSAFPTIVELDFHVPIDLTHAEPARELDERILWPNAYENRLAFEVPEVVLDGKAYRSMETSHTHAELQRLD
jgi:uncharacterized protein (TIGR02996 family)